MADVIDRLGVLASALSGDAREAAVFARQLSVGGILFDAYMRELNLTQLSQTGRREFRHVIASNNLELVGLRYDAGPEGLGPARRSGAALERVIADLQRVMETAAGLMSPLVCLDLGTLPPAPPEEKPVTPKVTPEMAGLILLPTGLIGGAPPPPPPSRELSDADRAAADQMDAVLAEVCASADRFGVTLALRSDLSSFASLERVIARARCPWLGVDLDPVAVLRDAWPTDEIMSRLGALIRHVRVRDAVLGSEGRTRPAEVGKGSVNWGEMLAAVDAAGYGGWMTIDPTELADRRAGAVAAVNRLGPAR
ncbi:MAG TPA: TIM barrel protein [Tepidisphaeraceae bacterium]|jgi:sugar phosphate isomerase/epimerase